MPSRASTRRGRIAVRRPGVGLGQVLPPTPGATSWLPTLSTSTYLKWPKPPLTDPTTIQVTSGASTLTLAADQDYILALPTNASLTTGLNVNGGRNIHVIGGEITCGSNTRAMYFVAQRGWVYVEGVAITGNVLEGINLDQRLGGNVILQNIYVEHAVITNGSHSDLLQTWAGPSRLYIDRFRGVSDYQGMFLTPRQQWQGSALPVQWELSRIQVETGAYSLWRDEQWPMNVDEVYAVRSGFSGNRDAFLWPKPSTPDHSWDTVIEGVPSAPFVNPAAIGRGYTSVW